MKRIVVCCDGTWQNGTKEVRTKYTNVLRLGRAIMQEDVRIDKSHPIAQVVYYQPGIGTDQSLYSRYVEGTTGSSLGDKVEEAYSFIAHNYNPGDEIFLFGFSRGAYTARMVAQFIGEIGVLDRTDMDSFGEIFINYQNYGRTEDQAQKKIGKQALAPWQDSESNGKKRVGQGKFSVKFLGVWDTVGSVGLPGRLIPENNIFGFSDSLLGDHIERAYQALAINETRYDFVCNKLQRTPAGKAKNQYVKQVWFSGAHSDIGGSYNQHDLSDLALIWMANELDKYLSLDFGYLQKHIEPVAPWGKQDPHDSATGIFLVAARTKRPLPTKVNDDVTQEFVHESVLQQTTCPPEIQALVKKYPEIVCPLGSVEKEFRKNWPYDKNSLRVQQYDRDLKNSSTH